LLEEIIDMINREEKEAFLITLDAQKAFDSVDHDYLLNILEVYNFPKQYITWVKTIYTKLEANVLVNGFTTMKFKIRQSVKQGDALSCALFILAIEPLLNSIQNNINIKPVNIVYVDPSTGIENTVEIKKSGFADDITCLTSDRDSLQEIINEYERFSSYSGVHLNVNKTEILVIGKKTEEKVNFELNHQGKKVTIIDQDMVKICGITYSNNKEMSYERNISEKIDKLKNQLLIWKQRNLSLEGKIMIVKTFGLSQLIYSLQSTYINEQDLKRIDLIITRFIWNLKESNLRPAGKIRKGILLNNIMQGGLNSTDIFALDKAIKYKSLLQARVTEHPVQAIYNKYLSEIGFNFSNYTCFKIEKTFIGKAVTAHIENRKKIHEDVKLFINDTEGIHKNYYGYVQNKSIVTNDYVNIRQNNMLTRLVTHNINKFQDLHKEKMTNSQRNLYLDVHQVYNTFPSEWRKLLTNTRREHGPITGEIYLGLNKWVQIGNVSLKLLTDSFKKKEDIDVNEYLLKKHPTIDIEMVTKNPFLTNRKIFKDIKVRNLNYKMLHNIYPTMHHLFKWKIKETENCSLCNCKETLRHVTFDCPIASNVRTILQDILKYKFNVSQDITLNYENMLFGVSCTESEVRLNSKQKGVIDQLLVLVKQKLILQREDKVEVTYAEIISLFDERRNISKYIATKNRVSWDAKVWGLN